MSVHARFRARILANAKEAERNAIESDDEGTMRDYLEDRERYMMTLEGADQLTIDMPDQADLLIEEVNEIMNAS